MRDAANLNAGAIVLQRFFEPALDSAIVAVLLHVDKIDDDETRDHRRKSAKTCDEQRSRNGSQ